MLRSLLHNHVFANLTFVLVLVTGLICYQMLPRQQDPTVNFNWIVVTTLLPGASAQDVEKKITDPLEDAIRTLPDLKFVSSNSREADPAGVFAGHPPRADRGRDGREH